MNPDEQDRNPFRRRTSASSRTGRYLSGRPNFSQQQTPDFFSQAMAQNTPAPTQKNRVNKKPIFITLGILGIIAFIVLTVTVIIPMIGDVIASKDKNHSFLELQATIAEYREDVLNMYSIFSAANKENHLWIPLEDKETMQQSITARDKIAARVKEFKEKINGFGGVKAYDYFGNQIEVDLKLDYIKKEIDLYLVQFEKINKIDSLIVDVYMSNGDQTKINAIRSAYEDKEMSEIADTIESFYKVYREYEKDERFSKCMNDAEYDCDMDPTRLYKEISKTRNCNAYDAIMKQAAKRVIRDEEQNLANTINEVYALYNEKVVHE